MAELKDIGRYKMLREIGKGGMARVYLAFDPQLQCNVALKVLAPHPDPRIHANLKNLFAKEAQVLAQLNHPNVIRVFDLNFDAADPYISMEFVEGLSLAQFLRKNTDLDLKARIKLFADICRGVAAIHSKGVVHRDLKPDNVMVSNSGDVKVMDFGIVEDFRGQNNVIAGTPAFMAPEQIKSGQVDTRSDIFSLGVIGAILFGGSNPFQGSTLASVHERQLTTSVQFPPSLPQSLRALLESCVQLDARERPADAESVVRTLEDSRIKSPRGFFSKTSSAAAFCVLSALIFAVSFIYRYQRSSAPDLSAYYAAIEKCHPNCSVTPQVLTDALAAAFPQLKCGDGTCTYLEKTCGLCAQDCGGPPSADWNQRPACISFSTPVHGDANARAARAHYDKCAFTSNLPQNTSPQIYVSTLVSCVRKFDNPVINDCAKEYLSNNPDFGVAATKFTVCIVKGPRNF